MNKTLSLALAATAIAATSTSFISTAEAGGRGGLRFHFHSVPTVYSAPSESYAPRRRTRVIVKQVTKYVEKPAAAAKNADGQGRQFDPTSKTWFDGKGYALHGPKGMFAFDMAGNAAGAVITLLIYLLVFRKKRASDI